MNARLHLFHAALLVSVMVVASRMAPGVDLRHVLLWPAVGTALVLILSGVLVLRREEGTGRELAQRLLLPLVLILAMALTMRAIRLGGVIKEQARETAAWQAAVDEGLANPSPRGRQVWLANAQPPLHHADFDPLRTTLWIAAGLEGLAAAWLLARRVGRLRA